MMWRRSGVSLLILCNSQSMRALHEASFIEEKARVHAGQIPGLDGIMKVLGKVLMPAMFDPFIGRYFFS